MSAALKAHPFASAARTLTDDEYAQLVDDIRRHGQRRDIVLYEGMILDGRHRARACADLGIEPRVRTFTGTSEEAKALVWSENAVHREQTAPEKLAFRRRLYPEDFAPRPAGRRKGGQLAPFRRSVAEVATAVGVSARSVKRYIAVQRDVRPVAETLADMVDAGSASLDEVASLAKVAQRDPASVKLCADLAARGGLRVCDAHLLATRPDRLAAHRLARPWPARPVVDGAPHGTQGALVLDMAWTMLTCGVANPITIYEGKVLDGRLRQRALALLFERIPPDSEAWPAVLEVAREMGESADFFAGTADEARAREWTLNRVRAHHAPDVLRSAYDKLGIEEIHEAELVDAEADAPEHAGLKLFVWAQNGQRRHCSDAELAEMEAA